MRILFLSDFYPPLEIGGYEQWCHEVATRLKKLGTEVIVLTSRYGVTSGVDNISDGVIRQLYLQTDNSYYRPIDFFLKRPSQERNNIRILSDVVSKFLPDIAMVWGMWNLSHKLPQWIEQSMPGRVAYYISSYWPMDLDPHRAYWQLPARRPAMEFFKHPLRNLAINRLRKEGYPPGLRFDHAVCCSSYVRESLVDAGCLPSNSRVVYGGTDVEPFLIASNLNKSVSQNGRLRLLYFGRLIHDKGVHTAIEAVGSLKQQGLEKGVELTILGSGHPDYEAKLRQLVVQLNIGDQVAFVEHVHRDEIPAWLGRHDVFLFTSIWPEPMARSVMEAMAAGLLVIGTEVGGQAEMLKHGLNALTFDPEDSETLAAHILQMRTDPATRMRLASAGQQMIIQQFTLDRMVDEIQQFLLDMINDAPEK